MYTGVSLTPAMTNKMVQITVEILDVLATATKEMGQSRASEFKLRLTLLAANIGSGKFVKKVAGRTDLEDGLKKLETLTNEEIAMAIAQLAKVADNININVTGVSEGVRGIDEKVQVVADEVRTVGGEVRAVGGEVRAVGGEVRAVGGEVRAVGGEVQVVRRNVQAIEGEVQVVKGEVLLVIDNVQAVDDQLQAIAEGGQKSI